MSNSCSMWASCPCQKSKEPMSSMLSAFRYSGAGLRSALGGVVKALRQFACLVLFVDKKPEHV
jgi:diacylglycerol kinase